MRIYKDHLYSHKTKKVEAASCWNNLVIGKDFSAIGRKFRSLTGEFQNFLSFGWKFFGFYFYGKKKHEKISFLMRKSTTQHRAEHTYDATKMKL